MFHLLSRHNLARFGLAAIVAAVFLSGHCFAASSDDSSLSDAISSAKTLFSFNLVMKGLLSMGFQNPYRNTKYFVRNFELASGASQSIFVMRDGESYSLRLGSADEGSSEVLSSSSAADFLSRTENLDLVRSKIGELMSAGAKPAAVEVAARENRAANGMAAGQGRAEPEAIEALPTERGRNG